MKREISDIHGSGPFFLTPTHGSKRFPCTCEYRMEQIVCCLLTSRVFLNIGCCCQVGHRFPNVFSTPRKQNTRPRLNQLIPWGRGPTGWGRRRGPREPMGPMVPMGPHGPYGFVIRVLHILYIVYMFAYFVYLYLFLYIRRSIKKKPNRITLH